MSKSVENLIIGGGAAGICMAHLLQDRDTLLLESRRAIGGLCGTISWKDCLFDLGGHVLTTKHEDVLEFLRSYVPLHFQPRRAFVAHENQIIRYPFQKYFTDLNQPRVVERCENKDGQGRFPEPRHFGEYLVTTLGEGIYEEFAQPYNEKLWGKPLSRMSPEWGGERVAPRKDSPAASSKLDRLPLTSETMVGYPKVGGFSTIFDTLAKPLKNIRTESAVKQVDLERQQVETIHGEIFHYSRLISTIPLDIFISMTQGLSEEVVRYADALEAVDLRIVLLKHDGRLPLDMHRLYVADKNVPPHKIVFPNTSSPFLAEMENHGIMAEVSEAQNSHLSNEELVRLLIDVLVAVGVLKAPTAITDSTVMALPKAYPVQTHRKRQMLGSIRGELEQHNVHLLGRFAEWDYINSDQVVKRALELASRL